MLFEISDEVRLANSFGLIQSKTFLANETGDSERLSHATWGTAKNRAMANETGRNSKFGVLFTKYDLACGRSVSSYEKSEPLDPGETRSPSSISNLVQSAAFIDWEPSPERAERVGNATFRKSITSVLQESQKNCHSFLSLKKAAWRRPTSDSLAGDVLILQFSKRNPLTFKEINSLGISKN